MVWSRSSLITSSLIYARPLRDAPGRRRAHGRPECRHGPPRGASPEETCCTTDFAASRLPCVPLPPPEARSSEASLRLPSRKPLSRGRRARLPGGQCPHAWRLPVRYRRRRCRARRRSAAARRRRVLRRRLVLAAPVAQPRQQVGPPGAVLRLGGLQPVFRVGRGGLADLVAGLRIARRIHQRGDVTAGRQDEPALAAEQLRAAVAVLPRRDVVGDARDEVGVGIDPATGRSGCRVPSALPA